MSCFPDGKGGTICDGGVDIICPENLVLSCNEQGKCMCIPKPYICEAHILYQKDNPQAVTVVPDPNCPDVGLAIAMSVMVARMMIIGTAR